MAVPQQLLQQLLALDENVQGEFGHALLDSVDTWVDGDLVGDEILSAPRWQPIGRFARVSGAAARSCHGTMGTPCLPLSLGCSTPGGEPGGAVRSRSG